MTERIADNLGMPEHDEAAMFFNRLVIDLKKQLLGYEHEEITMNRLNEATSHIGDILRCRREMKKY